MNDALPARPIQVTLDSVADLDQAWRLCEAVAQSDLVPKTLRGRPANVLLVYMMGREIGLSLGQAVREIYCPPSGQPQMRGRLLLARLRASGHDYTYEFDDAVSECTFTLIRGDNGRSYAGKFGLTAAKAAGLVQETNDGQLVARSQDGRPMPWEMYREDMLFWRAVARAVNRGAPEVAMGFDLIEAGHAEPAEVMLTPQAPAPPSPQGGAEASRTAPRDAAPPPGEAANPAAGPTLGELSELDAQGRAAGSPAGAETGASTGGEAGGAAADEDSKVKMADRRRLGRLAGAFKMSGWDPAKHQADVLGACTAFCRRPIASASDLTQAEAIALEETLHKLAEDAPADVLPVILADKAEEWRQAWRQEDPDGFEEVL